MAFLSEDLKLEIKYRNEIDSVISQYVDLKRRGKNLVGLCPFHNEKTPSFTVYPENGSFYCFGCGTGGDVITFTSLIENLDYMEAVRMLADRSGIVIPENSGYDDSMQKLKNLIFEINREAARYYHAYLMSEGGKWALDYLTGRGLTIETIRHFGLGAAPDSWDGLLKYMKSKGYNENDLYTANLLSRSSSGGYFDRFRNRVMFPVFNLRGNVVAFSGRQRPDDQKAQGKYVNTSDTPVYKKSQHLFGFNFAKNDCAERVILVEGNMDVISLHQAGFTNAVAALGTAFGEEQARLLSKYTKEIVIALDADEAGQKAVRRTIESLKDIGVAIRVVVVPDGKDPDEFIKNQGAERFKALLDGAVSDIEYKLLSAVKGVDVTTDSGRLTYLQNAAEVLASCNDSITVDLYAGRLAEKYGVSKNTLINRINELKSKNIRTEQKKEIKKAISPVSRKESVNPEEIRYPRAARAEKGIISILLSHPDLYTAASTRVKPEDVLTELNRRILSEVYSILESGQPAVDITLFGDKFSPSELGYIVSLQNSVISEKNQKTVLNDCMNILLEEKSIAADSTDDTVDEWAKKMQEIANKKKGE